MKKLILTENFSSNPIKSEEIIEFEKFVFSGGEPHIKLDVRWADLVDKRIHIHHKIKSFEDLGLLLIAVDALRRVSKGMEKGIHLFLPYFPGARQDRRMVPGESLTVKVYADIIKGLNLNGITIFDPHSDVTYAVLNNVQVINNHKFVLKVLQEIYPQTNASMPLLISPDAGANKKITKLAEYLFAFNKLKIVKCDKTRDITNGKISGFEVYANDLEGRDCIIVDDICDGGGTFIGLAEELKKKNAGDLYLIVSHGIFSKGLKPLRDTFKAIYTTNSFVSESDVQILNREANTEMLKQIKLSEIL